jgi:bacterial/archaeal transporter family-2 protein
LVVALFYALSLGAGASVALQQVLNASLRTGLGSSWLAGCVSYAGGTVVMLILFLFSGEPWFSAGSIARTPFLSWTGGLFGAVFIGISILMVPRLGAATVLALVVVGQMLCSLVLDHFGLFGLPQHPATPVRLVGAACLILGAGLIRI